MKYRVWTTKEDSIVENLLYRIFDQNLSKPIRRILMIKVAKQLGRTRQAVFYRLRYHRREMGLVNVVKQKHIS